MSNFLLEMEDMVSCCRIYKYHFEGSECLMKQSINQSNTKGNTKEISPDENLETLKFLCIWIVLWRNSQASCNLTALSTVSTVVYPRA